MKYNWQYDEWPDFTYSVADSEKYLLRFVEKTGYLSGLFKGLQENVRIVDIPEHTDPSIPVIKLVSK